MCILFIVHMEQTSQKSFGTGVKNLSFLKSYVKFHAFSGADPGVVRRWLVTSPLLFPQTKKLLIPEYFYPDKLSLGLLMKLWNLFFSNLRSHFFFKFSHLLWVSCGVGMWVLCSIRKKTVLPPLKNPGSTPDLKQDKHVVTYTHSCSLSKN